MIDPEIRILIAQAHRRSEREAREEEIRSVVEKMIEEKKLQAP